MFQNSHSCHVFLCFASSTMTVTDELRRRNESVFALSCTWPAQNSKHMGNGHGKRDRTHTRRQTWATCPGDRQTRRQTWKTSTSRCSDLFIKTKGNRQGGKESRKRLAGREEVTPQDAVASSQSELLLLLLRLSLPLVKIVVDTQLRQFQLECAHFPPFHCTPSEARQAHSEAKGA